MTDVPPQIGEWWVLACPRSGVRTVAYRLEAGWESWRLAVPREGLAEWTPIRRIDLYGNGSAE
jgi:hypothetical protein